jgi:asparagine synthase (glutamine-hydrolysing)
VDVESWNIQEKCYWRMEDAPSIRDHPASRIRSELEEVSRLVIRSDVPVGIALSGGLDSSAIAALTVRTYPGQLQAFSVGYPGHPPYDERVQAKALADH